MQFTCGVAIGMFTLGTWEPMYYYRNWSQYGGTIEKTPFQSDDDRAQQASVSRIH